MAKNVSGFSENLFEYYTLNVIVHVNFFSDLDFEYYFESYPEILLQVSPRRGHEIFSKKITGR